MIKIGITERGDAALDNSWINKINTVDGAIIITKGLNYSMFDNILRYKHKIILHVTCTGYGGTILEPNVQTPLTTLANLIELLSRGFSPNRIVLRVDPIIPTTKGINVAQGIIRNFVISTKMWYSGGRKLRVRYSLIDMYKHVQERFNNAGLHNPCININIDEIKGAIRFIDESFKGDINLEACAENIIPEHSVGCISKVDLDILGIKYKESDISSSAGQRTKCLCPSIKTELLNNKKRCKHGCLYCYWRD